MIRRNLACTIAAPFIALVLTGCMPKMTIEDMKAMRPKRPAELDRLNMFAGKWESLGEGTMAGLDEPLKATGSGETIWECDGWCLVERSTMEMGELGEMAMIAVWTWDAKAKKYRSFWVDNYGGTATGTSRYNEKTDTWCMKAKTRGPWGKTVGKGTVKFIDDGTMEWTWTEWDGLKLMKVFDMKGTSKRK